MAGHRPATRPAELTTCVVAVITLFMLFPILWMVISSFKAPADILTMPSRWFFVPTLDNYRAVLFGQQKIAGGTFPQVPDFPKHLTNSVVIALTSTGLALLVGCPAAYALARFRFRRSKDLSFYVLSIRMAPPFGVLIPFYIQTVVESYLGINEICLPVGHFRAEKGSEHFFAYNVERVTGRTFVHGKLVALGVDIISRLQENEHERITGLMDRLGLPHSPKPTVCRRRK